jgi:hypothetical protein
VSEADDGAAADPGMHRADPAARRNFLLLLGGSVLILFAARWSFLAYLDSLAVESTRQMLASSKLVGELIDAVLYCCAALLGGLSWYWHRLAGKIGRAARYPFEQARLFHDMRILRGEAKAVYVRRTLRMAWLMCGAAALVLAAALAQPLYLARIHPIVAQGGLTPQPADGNSSRP